MQVFVVGSECFASVSERRRPHSIHKVQHPEAKSKKRRRKHERKRGSEDHMGSGTEGGGTNSIRGKKREEDVWVDELPQEFRGRRPMELLSHRKDREFQEKSKEEIEDQSDVEASVYAEVSVRDIPDGEVRKDERQGKEDLEFDCGGAPWDLVENASRRAVNALGDTRIACLHFTACAQTRQIQLWGLTHFPHPPPRISIKKKYYNALATLIKLELGDQALPLSHYEDAQAARESGQDQKGGFQDSLGAMESSFEILGELGKLIGRTTLSEQRNPEAKYIIRERIKSLVSICLSCAHL